MRACVRASVCPNGRSPEVALTPRPSWLAFRSIEKPGGVGDDRAESGLNLPCEWPRRPAICGHARQR